MKLNPARESVLDRFLRYVKIDTRSQEDSESYPSTEKQWDLLNLLRDELKSLKHSLRHDWRSWGQLCGTVLTPQAA